MKFDLATLAKRQRTSRRKVVALRPIQAPAIRATDLYQSAYRPIIKIWSQALPTILAEYERSLSALTTDSAVELSITIEEAERQTASIILLIKARMTRWSELIEAWHRSRWRSNVLSATGVDLTTLIEPEDMRETIQAVIERNVGLVKSVSDDARRRIADATFRGLTNRTPARKIAREIREAVAIERRRALRIASDQLVKITSTLNEERRRQAGISAWAWIHSGKLHPRPEHTARDNKLYSDDPADIGTEYEGRTVLKPPTDRPGQLPFCGCTSRAVLIL